MPSAQKDIAVGHLLLERILDARRKSDALFDIVKPAAIFERPIPERHRIIFTSAISRRSTGIFCMKTFWV